MGLGCTECFSRFHRNKIFRSKNEELNRLTLSISGLMDTTEFDSDFSPTPDTYPLGKQDILALVSPIESPLDGPLDKEAQKCAWKIVEVIETTFTGLIGKKSRGIAAGSFARMLNVVLERYDVDRLRASDNLGIISAPTKEEEDQAIRIMEHLRDSSTLKLMEEGLVSFGRQARILSRYIDKWRAHEKLVRLFPEEFSYHETLKASEKNIELVKMVEQPPRVSLSWIEEISKKQKFLETHSISNSILANVGTKITLEEILRRMSPKIFDNDPEEVKIAKNEQRIVAERLRSIINRLRLDKPELSSGEVLSIIAAYLELEDIKKVRSNPLTLNLFDIPTELDRQRALEAYTILSEKTITELFAFGAIHLNWMMNNMNSYAEKWRAQLKFEKIFREGATLRETLDAALSNAELMKGRLNPPGFDSEVVDRIREKMNVIASNSIITNLIRSTQSTASAGYKRL